MARAGARAEKRETARVRGKARRCAVCRAVAPAAARVRGPTEGIKPARRVPSGMPSTPVWVGPALTIAIFAGGVLLFFQTADPMVLIFAVVLSAMGWGVAFVVHLLRHGIPVRVVDEGPKRP